MRRRFLLIFVLAGTIGQLALLAGCQRDFSTEADALRERVMLLEREVEVLERRNTELRAELRRMSRQRDEVPEEIHAATPHVVDLAIGRWSHGRIAGEPDDRDALRIYLNPIDGRGRFVPLVGTVRMHAAVLPDDADDATTLARIEFTPDQMRDAYRSGITGTHYTLTVPIDWPAELDAEAARAEPVIVRVVYIDGHTGERFSAERSIRWRTDQRRRPERRESRP